MNANDLLQALHESTKLKKLDWNKGATSDMYSLKLKNGQSLVIQKELSVSKTGWDIVIYIYDIDLKLLHSYRFNDAPNRLAPLEKEFKMGVELMDMINLYVNKKNQEDLDGIYKQLKNMY